MGKPKYGPDDPAVHIPPSEQSAQGPVPKPGEPLVPKTDTVTELPPVEPPPGEEIGGGGEEEIPGVVRHKAPVAPKRR
jgi:hypothetical protein